MATVSYKHRSNSINVPISLQFGIILAIYVAPRVEATVTIVQAACTQGTTWTPAITTIQNWCLNCVCVVPNRSVCKANVLSGFGTITVGATGNACGGTVTLPITPVVTAPPVVTVPPVVTIPPVVTMPAVTTTTIRPVVPPVPVVTIPPVPVVTIPPVPVVTMPPVVTQPPGPGPVIVPPVTAAPGR